MKWRDFYMNKQKQKYCKRCGKFRDVSEFNKNRSTKDGLQAYCRTHANEYSINSQQKSINRDIVLLIKEGTIQDTKIEKDGAEFLLRSLDSRIKDEFPCAWNNRMDFARDVILKIKGFLERMVKINRDSG
jgi:hypothetical protein